MSRHRFTAAVDFARREALAVGAVAAAALLAGGFLEIADDMAEGDTLPIDTAILMLLRSAGDPNAPVGPHWLTIAATDFTALGSVAVLGFIVLTITALFAALGHLRQAAILLLASAGAVAWSQGLKSIFDRPRPEAVYHAVEVINASFPSGHALLSASVYLTLGALTASFAPRRRVKIFAVGAAVIATLMVGISRVFLGVHWPSDVAAGWCLGGAWALACWLALWAWEQRWRRPKPEA